MATYLFRRLLLILPTLIGATLLVFVIIQASPGSIADTLISAEGDLRPAERAVREAYLRKRYGLDSPIPVQYLRWLNKISPFGVNFNDAGKPVGVGFRVPDLGDSFVRGRPVTGLIADALPQTIVMQLIALPISYGIAIWIGVSAARNRNGLFDRTTGVTTLAFYSLPQIWVAVMLIGFLANRQYVHWFPTGDLSEISASEMPFLPGTLRGHATPGWLLDRCWHLILPVVCLSYANLAFLSKLTRGSLLDTIKADFVRTARAKGLSQNVILYRHAFRNSLIPLITYLGAFLPALLSGSVIVETVYGINGMGSLFVQAIQQKDPELILSLIVVSTVLSIAGTLLADIMNVIADPRVSYE